MFGIIYKRTFYDRRRQLELFYAKKRESERIFSSLSKSYKKFFDLEIFFFHREEF